MVCTVLGACVVEVFHELLDALHNARYDDSRVLLLTGSGNTFCSGVDLHYLLSECSDRRIAAKTMSDCLRSVDCGVRDCCCISHVRVNGHSCGTSLLFSCDNHGLYGSMSCCISHGPSQWERAIFDPPQLGDPVTDFHET